MPEIILNLDNHEVERLKQKAEKASAMYQREITPKQMLAHGIEAFLAAPLEQTEDQQPKIDADATKRNLKETLDEHQG